jgi:transposase
MISVEKREAIRRAYFIEKKSIRAIAREFRCCSRTVNKAIASSEAQPYKLSSPRKAPVLGPYKTQIDGMLEENQKLPKKQRYTSRRIYEIISEAGYEGSESTVRGYVSQQRKMNKKRKVYMPLEFDPGMDAQADWGEGVVIMGVEETQVQLFTMRLNYSRKPFMMAFPTQRQEAFFAGHVAAFHHFGGVPQRIAYDNLKTAVQRILEGRNRQEQEAFIAFRSHYLFESRFCNPGQGHEKGGVEHSVGYGRRNFMVPLPKVSSFEELNELLLARCQAEDDRTVDRQPMSIGEAWEIERPYLLPLPSHDFACCVTRPAKVNGYSQVTHETNRYSVPADRAFEQVVIKAYPFHIEVIHLDEVLARHPRSYEREQDIFDPVHYLPLLAQRPGAFEHAKPVRRWRETWPRVYETLLNRLQTDDNDGRGLKIFIQVLQLHRNYPAGQVEQAVQMALGFGCVSLDGIKHCLHQLRHPEVPIAALDLGEHPRLIGIGEQPMNLHCYDQLLTGGHNGH